MVGVRREPGIFGVTLSVGPFAVTAALGFIPFIQRHERARPETTKRPHEADASRRRVAAG